MIRYLDLKRINAAYDSELRAAIDDVLRSGWYLKGEATRRFEQHYADYIGTRHCVACGNGLDALTLILRGYIELGVMCEGDEVIVPANTFIASILAITECGLRPVLVEPSAETLQIDDAQIEAAITPRTRALMLVHLYGRCAYTERIGNICQQYNLKLIEDNAQAQGCTYSEAPLPASPEGEELLLKASPRGSLEGAASPFEKTGALGDAAGHSFYPGKNLGALGDGGAVTTNDDRLATVVRQLGNYGYAEKYVCPLRGRNSRMDELQAAMLDVKLQHLDADNRRRKEVAAFYQRAINNPLIRLPRCSRDSVWHIFPVFSERRDELQRHLAACGIETQVHYPIPPHLQQCYRALAADRSLPVTEQLSAEELSLPCHQAMKDDEVETVVESLNRFS
ncbi:MAG: DegT/DnrJ/EryC1/StrS family aminotransferase [Prevotella sp.]|nr:DegT/DnrJ/EryC1/StrS family aminotransferase [Prevotella sp.]